MFRLPLGKSYPADQRGLSCASQLAPEMFVGCVTSQQHASVSHGPICSDNFTCCHTEIQVADQTFHLTKSQYTDTGPTGHSTDPITQGAWQGSHWSANFKSLVWLDPGKIPAQAGLGHRTFRSRGGRLNQKSNKAAWHLRTLRYLFLLLPCVRCDWVCGSRCGTPVVIDMFSDCLTSTASLAWWLRRPPQERQIRLRFRLTSWELGVTPVT